MRKWNFPMECPTCGKDWRICGHLPEFLKKNGISRKDIILSKRFKWVSINAVLKRDE